MRSMWNGMISFGLVNIPVGMYPATKTDKVRFNMLHKEDGGRIHNQRVCQVCGEVVEYDELEKGYEYEKDHYVAITEEELEKAQPEATETINIVTFVDLEDIDPIYFEKPYYLVPDRKSDRVYTLLRETLKQTKKVGIARFVLRTREYLGAVRPHGNALVLDTMHFAEEIREAEDMPPADEKVNASELTMATQLVQAMAGKFEPEKYRDTYEEAVLDLIDKKLEGKKITAKQSHKKATNVVDIMSRLKASLEGADAPKAKSSAAKPKAKPAAKAKPAKKTARKPKLRLVA